MVNLSLLYRNFWGLAFWAVFVTVLFSVLLFSKRLSTVQARGYDEIEVLDYGELDMPTYYADRYWFRLHDKASGIEMICVRRDNDGDACVATGRKW